MPRKPNPPLIQQVPELRGQLVLEPEPATGEQTKDDKKGKSFKGVTLKIAEARLLRLRHQNSKLSIELKKLRGAVVPVEHLKRTVLGANLIVRNQLLSLPDRLSLPLVHLTDPREIRLLLRESIVDCLNDLAYERESTAPPSAERNGGETKDSGS